MTTPIGPDFIALQVRNLAASRRFYLEIFGFEASAHCPPGAAILSPLADGPFGRFFVARDPDGYAITFHTART